MFLKVLCSCCTENDRKCKSGNWANSEETIVRIKARGDGGLTQERAVKGRKVDIFCR